ncbi:MAG: hypothetical protein ACYC66_10200 [Chloroflexota bacterium]
MTRGIERTVQRSRQYFYDDGLSELAAGAIFLAIGLLFLVEALATPGSLPGSFSAIGLVILVGGGMWLANRVVRWAKARITYPRTGYVRYRRPARTPRQRAIVMALAAVISIATALLLSRLAPASLTWVPALQGLLVGGYMLYMGYNLGLARFYLLAGLSALVGAAASLAGLGDTLGSAAYFGAVGIALLCSGGVNLYLYLRRSSPAGGEQP